MTLMTNYYMQEDNQDEMREIIRSLQRQSAHVHAKIVRKDYKTIKKQFKTDGNDTLLNTKAALQNIRGQIDNSIKGKVRKALQKKVEETLPKYEEVF